MLKNGELHDNGEEENSKKYDPVQSLAYDHGVSLIPLAMSPSSKDFTIGHHELQVIRNKNIYSLNNIFLFKFVRFSIFTNLYHSLLKIYSEKVKIFVL